MTMRAEMRKKQLKNHQYLQEITQAKQDPFSFVQKYQGHHQRVLEDVINQIK